MSCSLCELPQSDPTFIAEFDHSRAFLYWDQDAYRGRSMLVAKTHYDHLHLVPDDVQTSMIRDMSNLTTAILNAFGGFRANHMSLGNQVPHLHWHIIPRYPSDLNAGNAPIHSPDERRLSDAEYQDIAAQIRTQLSRQEILDRGS